MHKFFFILNMINLFLFTLCFILITQLFFWQCLFLWLRSIESIFIQILRTIFQAINWKMFSHFECLPSWLIIYLYLSAIQWENFITTPNFLDNYQNKCYWTHNSYNLLNNQRFKQLFSIRLTYIVYSIVHFVQFRTWLYILIWCSHSYIFWTVDCLKNYIFDRTSAWQ